MNQRRIFLTGMPAVGKTYWGRVWATESKRLMLNTDGIITGTTGKSIPQIFAEEGEARFRQLELETVRHIIENEKRPVIVATGGGTFIQEPIRKLMLENGIVVQLQSTFEELAARIAARPGKRPLLEGPEGSEELLHRLWKQRAPIYNLAHYTYSTDSINAKTIHEILEACTDPRS